MDWGDCVQNGVATVRCIPVVLSNLINTALGFAGATALAFIIISGLKLMNSGGDQKKVAEAKGTLTYAIIGLVLVMLSFAIVNVVAYLTDAECITKFGFTNCN